MLNRIIVHLLPEEKEALQQMSNTDVRPPSEQIRFLVISEAIKRGILSVNKNIETPRQSELQHG